MELARFSSSSAISFCMLMPIVLVFLPIGLVAICSSSLFVKIRFFNIYGDGESSKKY